MGLPNPSEQIHNLTVMLEASKRSAAAWEATAEQNQRNTEYYRGLVVEIGELFPGLAYTADDGTRQHDVLCGKVPQLVKDLSKERVECLKLAKQAVNTLEATGLKVDPSGLVAYLKVDKGTVARTVVDVAQVNADMDEEGNLLGVEFVVWPLESSRG